MSMLEELNTIVESAGLPVETGVFSKPAPTEYVVITPISEHFTLFSSHLGKEAAHYVPEVEYELA